MAEKKMVVFTMEHSNYTIVYPEDEEYNVKVYRRYGTEGEEDVTAHVWNNVMRDLLLEAINLREIIASKT